MKQTEYVVSVNRPVSKKQAVRILDAVLHVDDSVPIPVVGSGGVGPGGIAYEDFALGAKAVLRVVE